jgi:hypothetical protein
MIRIGILDKKEESLELFTTYAQASIYIGVSRSTIIRWESNGPIYYTKDDRYIIVYNITLNKLNRGGQHNSNRFILHK